MNIYQRPLFRQAGGPIAPEMGPMMPPQGMPPAPMAAPQMMPPQGLDPRAAEAVGQVEQGAAMQAEQYGQNMMAGLDAAETPEEVINAMRGNQRPLEARYGELAELVGQEDAQRTPETVLALLQPVMMMTEQGAMDSGIGELMGQLTGNIDMMDESGAPTEMGQGVGSLMMAGVGQQPVANFSQGGAVQRFQVGGEASRLQELYSEMLPVYQGVMGGGEDQRDLTKAQIFFDIADRFGAFAAGIDPRTGERMQGSAAAQFGAAASGLGGQIGERLGAQDQQERALRVAALQGAAGEFSAERADERAAARAAAAAAAGEKDRALGSLFNILDAEGNVVQQGVPIATQGQYAKIIEENPGIRIVPFDASGEIGKQYQAVDSQGNVVASEFLPDRAAFNVFVAANPNTTIREAITPTPGEIGKQYEAVDSQGNVVASAFLADRTKFEAFVAANPNTTIREAVTPTPGEIGKQYEAVDAQGKVVASAFLADRIKFEAFVAANPNTTIREAVTPTPGEIGKQYEAVDAQGKVVASAFLADRTKFEAFVAANPNTTIREAVTPTPGEIGKQYEAVDSQGNVVASAFLADRTKFEAFVAANPNTTIREAVTPAADSCHRSTYAGQPRETFPQRS
jgi:predicted nucleotidyltransferase